MQHILFVTETKRQQKHHGKWFRKCFENSAQQVLSWKTVAMTCKIIGDTNRFLELVITGLEEKFHYPYRLPGVS